MRRAAYILAFLAGLLARSVTAQTYDANGPVVPTWRPMYGEYGNNSLTLPSVPPAVQRRLDEGAASPLSSGGMLLDRDSVFYLDSIAVRQVPPAPLYDRLWWTVQVCSGLTITEAERAEWTISAAPGDGFFPPGGRTPAVGYTAVERHNIVVLEKFVVREQLLKHEMLHAIIWENFHIVGHPMEYFEPCGLLGQ